MDHMSRCTCIHAVWWWCECVGGKGGKVLLNLAANFCLQRFDMMILMGLSLWKIKLKKFLLFCLGLTSPVKIIQRNEVQKENGILPQQFCNFRQPSCIGPFLTRIHLCRLWVNMPAFEEFILLNNIDHINCHLQKCKIWRIYSSDALASIELHIFAWAIPQLCKKQSGPDIKNWVYLLGSRRPPSHSQSPSSGYFRPWVGSDFKRNSDNIVKKFTLSEVMHRSQSRLGTRTGCCATLKVVWIIPSYWKLKAGLTSRVHPFSSAWIFGQNLLKDSLVLIEVFPFGLFCIGNLITVCYGICLQV